MNQRYATTTQNEWRKRSSKNKFRGFRSYTLRLNLELSAGPYIPVFSFVFNPSLFTAILAQPPASTLHPCIPHFTKIARCRYLVIFWLPSPLGNSWEFGISAVWGNRTALSSRDAVISLGKLSVVWNVMLSFIFTFGLLLSTGRNLAFSWGFSVEQP